MDGIHDEEETDFIAGLGMAPLVSGIAWQMFTQTGLPGYYLLYRDIGLEDERSPLD